MRYFIHSLNMKTIKYTEKCTCKDRVPQEEHYILSYVGKPCTFHRTFYCGKCRKKRK